jgi:Glycosyltransferase family 17
VTLLAGDDAALGSGAKCPPAPAPTLRDDGDLEQHWQARPDVALLVEAAGAAAGAPLARRLVWSRRLRAAGLGHLCPLVATAQDGAHPLGRRALSAAAAWTEARDCRARAVLRCLLPALTGDDAASVLALLGQGGLAGLDQGPFVWSVTPFFNELEMLEARLAEMSRVVDRFVIIEARQTFRGEPKPLYYQDNRHRFTRWSTQVDHVVVDLPDGPDAWARERHQRNIGQPVLAELGAAPDDLVLLTDLDEIVRADRMATILSATQSSPVMLAMPQYWYSLDWKEPKLWGHPKAFRAGQVPATATYHDVRHSLFPVVANSGWHLSWFGNEERFGTKLRSFSHSEYDTPERRGPAFQRSLVSGGVDIHGRALLPAQDHFPASLSLLFGEGAR